MKGLDNLNKRLQYYGGNQEQRFIKDKLKSLKKALLYSYQAATAGVFQYDENGKIILDEFGNEKTKDFRCLINPDKLKEEYDNKILSIPYKDVCLNNEINKLSLEKKEEDINLKPGDVFCWKETNTYWLIYLQYLEEDAYFRADIRECKHKIKINDNFYYVYIRGPVETSIPWNQKNNIVWNDINYSLELYITKNNETLNFFHRFNKIKIDNKLWEIQAVSEYNADGIIQVYLKEDYQNTIQDLVEEENEKNKPVIEEPDINDVYIEGDNFAYPYDIKKYKIVNMSGGVWAIDSDKVKICNQDDNSVTIEIITGKSGSFNLYYNINESNVITFPVTIKSL